LFRRSYILHRLLIWLKAKECSFVLALDLHKLWQRESYEIQDNNFGIDSNCECNWGVYSPSGQSDNEFGEAYFLRHKGFCCAMSLRIWLRIADAFENLTSSCFMHCHRNSHGRYLYCYLFSETPFRRNTHSDWRYGERGRPRASSRPSNAWPFWRPVPMITPSPSFFTIESYHMYSSLLHIDNLNSQFIDS